MPLQPLYPSLTLRQPPPVAELVLPSSWLQMSLQHSLNMERLQPFLPSMATFRKSLQHLHLLPRLPALLPMRP